MTFFSVSQQWLKIGNVIVSLDGTGRVLQVGESDQPLTLAPFSPSEMRQQWSFKWSSDGYTAIASKFNNLRIAQIEDSFLKDVVKVGATIGNDPNFFDGKQKWTANVAAPDQRCIDACDASDAE